MFDDTLRVKSGEPILASMTHRFPRHGWWV
jgi:hypothetical protein